MENVKPEVRAIPLAVAVIHSVTEERKKKTLFLYHHSGVKPSFKNALLSSFV